MPAVAPPPRITETTVDAWAHCNDARCPGYGQQPVTGVHVLVEHSVASRGGDGIFASVIENSHEYLRFEDPDEIHCEHCSRTREITRQVRPTYQKLSGFPQDGLLHSPDFDPSVRHSKDDERFAAQEARMRLLEEKLAAALGEDDAQVG